MRQTEGYGAISQPSLLGSREKPRVFVKATGAAQCKFGMPHRSGVGTHLPPPPPPLPR